MEGQPRAGEDAAINGVLARKRSTYRRILYGLSLSSRSNQHSFLSYPPTMRWSPDGCTSMDEIQRVPGVSVLRSVCSARLYIRTYRCVYRTGPGMAGWDTEPRHRTRRHGGE